MENNNPDNKESASFNDALNHITRINRLLEQITYCKVAPFAMHPEFMQPNYLVRISLLQSYWQEIKPFCDLKEKEKMFECYKIQNFLIKKILIVSNRETQIDYNAYEKLDGFLDMLEGILRDYAFKHGLSNPLKSRDLGI